MCGRGGVNLRILNLNTWCRRVVASFLLLSLYPSETLGKSLYTAVEHRWRLIGWHEQSQRLRQTSRRTTSWLYLIDLSVNTALWTLYVHLFTFQLVNCAAGEEFGTSMLVLSWDDIFVCVFFVKINIRISFERLLLYVLEFFFVRRAWLAAWNKLRYHHLIVLVNQYRFISKQTKLCNLIQNNPTVLCFSGYKPI